MPFLIIKNKIDQRKHTLPNVTKKLAKELEREAKANAFWSDRTGMTRQAIKGKSEGASNGAVLSLGHYSKVGLYHEKGTGIYGPKGKPITPKRAKYLVFMGDHGQLVFAKSVKGMPKKPIVEPTVKKNIPKIINRVGRHFKL